MTDGTTAFRVELPAQLERLREARDWAEGIAGGAGLDEDDRFQVKLAMSEAVTNAIMHGSSSGDERVVLSAVVAPDALRFEVADPGRPAGAGPVERLDEGGRGLELVSMIMDEVTLERGRGGASLRFAKRLGRV